jgi:hypothetical protein
MIIQPKPVVEITASAYEPTRRKYSAVPFSSEINDKSEYRGFDDSPIQTSKKKPLTV